MITKFTSVITSWHHLKMLVFQYDSETISLIDLENYASVMGLSDNSVLRRLENLPKFECKNFAFASASHIGMGHHLKNNPSEGFTLLTTITTEFSRKEALYLPLSYAKRELWFYVDAPKLDSSIDNYELGSHSVRGEHNTLIAWIKAVPAIRTNYRYVPLRNLYQIECR